MTKKKIINKETTPPKAKPKDEPKPNKTIKKNSIPEWVIR